MFRKRKPASQHPVDPFGFWPGVATSIAGIGGAAEPVDGQAAFHTVYTAYRAGPMTFRLQFEELVASSGELEVMAMALPADGGEAKVQSRGTIMLPDLAASGGRYELPILVRDQALYALYGRVQNQTDARAQALFLSTDRPRDADVARRKLIEARDLFAIRRQDRGLVVDRRATLSEPLSQMCTAAQFDEADYARWLRLLQRPIHRHRKQWEYVYICRVLEHLGALKAQARGLGFGCGVEPFVTASDLPAQDRRAAEWRNTNQHLVNLAALADPAICPPDLFSARVESVCIDMNDVPADRVGYDFCWSSCSLEHLGSIEKGLAFIERSLDTLRPGGVAVHTTELNLTSDVKTMMTGGTVLFRRRDLQGLARKLVKAGHDVVPITFDQGDQPEDFHVDTPPYSTDLHFKLALGQFVSTSFGLVVRKAA
jgi:hypothetical protein